jgi:hypothetical protein
MSVFLDASKEDQQKIRKAMLVQADESLKRLYVDANQRHAAARVMVDRALAQERRSTHVDTGEDTSDAVANA